MTRWHVAPFVAGLVSSAVIAGAIQLLGYAVQNYLVSRDGVSPIDSWQIQVEASVPDDVSNVNRRCLNLLEQASGPTVGVADYGASMGAPALAIYDNRPNPQPLFEISGRWFSHAEMDSPSPVMVIRDQSYLLTDPSLGGNSAVLPDGAQIAVFPKALNTQFDFVINMAAYLPTVLPQTVYVSTGDVAIVDQLAALFESVAGPTVTVSGPTSVASYLKGYLYTGPMAIAVLLCVVMCTVIVFDEVAADSHRRRVARLVGATRLRASWRIAQPVVAATFIGAAVGGVLLALGPSHPPGSLPPMWLPVSVLLGAVVPPCLCAVVALPAGLHVGVGKSGLRYAKLDISG